jgi:predicted dehydrogenase
VRHFYECIRHGRQPWFSGEQARRALEVVLMGYEASRTGVTVYRHMK